MDTAHVTHPSAFPLATSDQQLWTPPLLASLAQMSAAQLGLVVACLEAYEAENLGPKSATALQATRSYGNWKQWSQRMPA